MHDEERTPQWQSQNMPNDLMTFCRESKENVKREDKRIRIVSFVYLTGVAQWHSR